MTNETKRKYLTIPPEMTDGSCSTIIDMSAENAAQVLMDTVMGFFVDAEPGETATLGVVMMSDAEVSALPEL